MKFSTALVLSLTASTASAFAPAARPALSTRFASTTEGVEATPAAPVAVAAPAAPVATTVVDGAVVTAGAAIEEGHGVDLPIMEEASTGRIQPYVFFFLADFCFVLESVTCTWFISLAGAASVSKILYIAFIHPGVEHYYLMMCSQPLILSYTAFNSHMKIFSVFPPGHCQ